MYACDRSQIFMLHNRNCWHDGNDLHRVSTKLLRALCALLGPKHLEWTCKYPTCCVSASLRLLRYPQNTSSPVMQTLSVTHRRTNSTTGIILQTYITLDQLALSSLILHTFFSRTLAQFLNRLLVVFGVWKRSSHSSNALSCRRNNHFCPQQQANRREERRWQQILTAAGLILHTATIMCWAYIKRSLEVEKVDSVSRLLPCTSVA